MTKFPDQELKLPIFKVTYKEREDIENNCPSEKLRKRFESFQKNTVALIKWK